MKSIFSKAYIKNAEEVSLTEDEMNQMGRGYGSYGNDEKPFAGMFKRARESAEQKARDAKIAELREKYNGVLSILDSGKNANEILEDLFEPLVPSNGEADTVMGEIVRAYNRIAYRLSNDGDVWFFGYGIETCAPSVKFLYDTIPSVEEEVDDFGEHISDYYEIKFNSRAPRPHDYLDYSEYYETWVNDTLPTIIVDYLREHNELVEEPRTAESRLYNRNIDSWVRDVTGENEEWDCNASFDGYVSDTYEAEQGIESECDYNVEVRVEDGWVYADFSGLSVNDLEDVMENWNHRWLEESIQNYTSEYEDEDDEYEGDDE